MANPLTGEFDAVLQVSGGTINRLLASMHQNQVVDPDRPSFPHSAALRIGDDRAAEGVRGTIWAQMAVPRVELIHGATDRFELEVGIRARYRPDPETQPLPEFINGTVRAVYRLATVDPHCLGWRAIASDYIWPRVEHGSVSFTGTAVDDADIIQIARPVDDDAIRAHLTTQLVALLSLQFSATPQKVTGPFRLGSLRSLNFAGSSAVAVPIGLGADPPLGRLDSIDRIFLGGSDFALAVSRDYILAQVQGALEQFTAGFDRRFSIRTEIDLGFFEVKVVDVHYRVVLTSATAEWMPVPGNGAAVITVTISGEAQTSNSSLNMRFKVTQRVSLTFDSGAQAIVLAPLGSPSVDVSAGGLLGAALDLFHGAIDSAITSEMPNMVDRFGEYGMKSHIDDVAGQLRTLDRNASARLDRADFGPDGIVLGGRVSLTSLRPPMATFVKTNERDGYSAFESWIPGGRVDRFEWSWSWVNGGGTPGTDSEADRFLLRPRGGVPTKFGRMMGLSEPLPGLDGTGRICLNLKGVRVDPYTGDYVPVDSGWHCSRFGFGVPLHPNGDVRRLLLREYEDSRPRSPGPPREVGLVEVGGAAADGEGANTLVAYVGDRWDPETAAALRDGLSACRRDDAGLAVLVLFREGLLEGLGSEGWDEFRELAKGLEAPLLVNEDVHGGWSASLRLPSERGEPAWRLISPRGGVTWMHDGRASADEVTAALDGYLFPSGAPSAEHQRPGLDLGSRVSPGALYSHFPGVEEFACPPPPVGRGIGSLVVTFAQSDSEASRAQVEQLRREQAESGEEDEGAFLAVVIDGPGEAAAIEAEQGDGYATIPDPVGVIARRFEVRHWPTTVRVDERGIVTAVEVGLNRSDPASRESA